jgi:hypothetical protein
MVRLGDDPRSIILRRRALMLGSALAALSGCSSEPAAVAPSTVVDVPSAGSARALPEPEGRITKAEGPSRDDGMPPLDVPSDADGVARRMFEQLAERIPKLHQRIDGIDRAVPPGCSVVEAGCEDRWEALIAELRTVEREIDALEPLCRGSSEQAQRYLERVRAHAEHARQRRDRAVARIERDLRQQGAAAVQRFEQLKATGQTATLRPCLSCRSW